MAHDLPSALYKAEAKAPNNIVGVAVQDTVVDRIVFFVYGTALGTPPLHVYKPVPGQMVVRENGVRSIYFSAGEELPGRKPRCGHPTGLFPENVLAFFP